MKAEERVSKHKNVAKIDFTIPVVRTYEIHGVTSFALPPALDRDENKFTLGLIRRDIHAHYNAGFGFTIGFDDVPVLAGQAIITVLNKMAGIVNRIVMGLEAETKRIGIFSSELHSK